MRMCDVGTWAGLMKRGLETFPSVRLGLYTEKSVLYPAADLSINAHRFQHPHHRHFSPFHKPSSYHLALVVQRIVQ